MKKLLILCLLVFSSFSVVACGSETKSEPDAVPMKPANAWRKKGFIMELPFIVLLIIL